MEIFLEWEKKNHGQRQVQSKHLFFACRLEESESRNRRLSHNLAQKETKIEGLEKRYWEILLNFIKLVV